MRRTVQVAALLCSSRVSAFIASSLQVPSTLKQASWSLSSSARTAFSSTRHRQDCHNGICTAANSRRAGSSRVAASASGDTPVESAPVEDFGSNVPIDKDRVAVLFDFDGTIGDTETPAMEVAYWELAPYFPAAAVGKELVDLREYVRNNAGKAFEFMLEKVEADRAAEGLPDIATVRAQSSEHPEIMKIVDEKRAEYGLKSLAELRASGELKDILTQQKEETVEALSVVARPVQGMEDTLKGLGTRSVPFAIATTSPKPRVPASVKACGLEGYFPADKIHSGESDFDPPRFKPDPSVYLKAAQFEGVLPPRCVAVEDSLSGVGSASNANMGMIVGYVGASHVTEAMKNEHAKSLRVRGARVVIDDMKNLLPLVECFADCMMKGVDYCEPIAKVVDTLPKSGVWE